MAEPPTLSRAMAWALALACVATMAVSYVDRQALAVLSVTITDQLGIDNQTYGWLASAFSFAYLAGAPLAGRLIDRVGARRGLLGSVLVWSLVAGAHALVPGVAVLFALRIALGLAEAPSFPASAQTISRVLPPAHRSAGFGLLFTGSSIGAMIPPLLTVPLAARWGWRVAMVVTALVGLAWIPMWLGLTGGRAARAAMALREPDRAPFRWSALLTNGAVLRAVGLVLASAPLNGFAINWAAKALAAAHDTPQERMSRYLWLPPLLFDVGAVTFGALASLRERRAPAIAHRGLVSLSALLALTIALLGAARTPWESTWVIGVAFAGGGGLYALLTADMLRRVAPAQVAAASGMTAAAQSLAIIVTNPIIGYVIDRTHRYGGVAIGLAALLIPGTAAWLATAPREGLHSRARRTG